MSFSNAMPFLVLDDDAVSVTPWLVSIDGQDDVPNPRMLKGWDYAASVKVDRRMEVDFRLASEQLEIPVEQLRLSIVVMEGTGSGTIPRVLRHILKQQVDRENQVVDISLNLASDSLSQRLALKTLVLLEGAPDARSSFSPNLPGSKLWEDLQDVALEGDAPRFPIEAISFRQCFTGRIQEYALWHLQWMTADMHRDISGSLRLYVNSDREDFIERITALDPLTMQTMLADVMGQLVSRLLYLPDLKEQIKGAEQGSVARQAQQWFELAFPDQSHSQVLSLYEHKPGEFNAAILAAAEVGSLS